MPARPRRKRKRIVPPQLEQHFNEAASWDSLLDRVSHNPSIDDDLRGHAIRAVKAARTILGNSWPREVYATDHPLARIFGDDAAHWTATFVEAVEALQATQALPKWPRLVRSLKDPTQAAGALAELRIAYRSMQVGAAIELEPAIPGGRYADMRLSLQGCEMFIEVSVAEQFPQSAQRGQADLDVLIPGIYLMIDNIAYGGRLLRMPQGEEFEWLEWRLGSFFHQVRATRVPRLLFVPNLLEIWCVGRDDPGFVALQKEGLVDTFTGPPIAFSPLGKLLGMIHDKVQQLPETNAGVLVLTPPSFLGQAPPTGDLAQVLRETIEAYPKVVALALVWRQLAIGQQPSAYQIDPWTLFTETVVHPPIVERMLLLMNPRTAFAECAAMAAAFLTSPLAS